MPCRQGEAERAERPFGSGPGGETHLVQASKASAEGVARRGAGRRVRYHPTVRVSVASQTVGESARRSWTPSKQLDRHDLFGLFAQILLDLRFGLFEHVADFFDGLLD